MSYYEKILNKHLCFVIRDILKQVERNGLSGKQHFYVSFLSNHPESIVPNFLKEDEEVTIIMQHEFWDLTVSESSFSVALCFDDSNETLRIPFASITNFVDPSEKFGLRLAPSYSPKPEHSLDQVDNIVSLDTFRKK